MSTLFYNDDVISTSDGESILDTLTRHSHEISSGCRSGVCQSCIMIAEAGTPSPQSQQGLSEPQKQLGYFLSCQCIPSEDMRVAQVDNQSLRTDATVIDKTLLSPDVIRLRLQAELNYLAGQYVTLWREDGVGRSYSLASLPEQDDFLEFHIKVIESGQFSPWVKETLNVGDSIQIQGPVGQCIFTAMPAQPLLLAGIGTGLAPLYGILKQALSQAHSGSIHLVLGAREAAQFYLVDELTALATQHAQLTLHFISQDNQRHQDIYQFCQQTFPDLKPFRVFLCGADSFVQKMRKQCFLSGAGMSAISADSFLACSS